MLKCCDVTIKTSPFILRLLSYKSPHLAGLCKFSRYSQKAAVHLSQVEINIHNYIYDDRFCIFDFLVLPWNIAENFFFIIYRINNVEKEHIVFFDINKCRIINISTHNNMIPQPII